MLAHPTRVLLILPQDVLDQARVLAGQATARSGAQWTKVQ
jgi:hypothetical protein